MSSSGAALPRSAVSIVVTCAVVIFVEGYDQSVYGAVLPVLVRDPNWDLTNAQAGYVGSAAFVGMLFGALTAGWLAARVSRRRVIIGCLVIMGFFGTWCAFATTGAELGVLRFLTGLGLGGVLPLTSTLTLAAASPKWRSMVYAVMFAAIPIGGLTGAVLAIPVVPAWGPSVMFALPLPLVVAAVALSWWILPDTPFGASAGRTATGPEPAGEGFGGRFLLPTALFVTATGMALMLWYGLNTWLPGIMREAGYDLGSALAFQVALNAGAAVGSVVVALMADRWGARPAVVAIYAGTALVLVMSMVAPPQAVLYLLITLAGTGAQSGLIVLNTLVNRSYPERLRAQALGLTLGVGRTGAIVAPSVVGLIVGSSIVGSFTLFAACALSAGLLAAVAVLVMQRRHRSTPDPTQGSSSAVR